MKDAALMHRISFWEPRLAGPEYRLLTGVLDSGFLNDGEVTTTFERSIAGRIDAKHMVAVTSGTAAISLALAAVGVGVGDEVIVPDVTFMATANAVSMIGAKPVLVDIDPATLNVAAECVEAAITSHTRAIVPVHVTGRPADMDGLMDIARRYGLRVVEDAAEGLTSKYRGRFLGTIGDAGCFSLSPNKTITTGQGGLIATNDDRLHARLRELKDQGRSARGTGGDDIHPSLGYNFKFTDLQAAVGMGQLTELDNRLARMKAIYNTYRDGLEGVPGIQVLPFRIDEGEVPQWTDVLTGQRDDLYRTLADQGMFGRRFWHPLHTQAPYRLPDDAFRHSTRLMPQAMWLPSAFTLTDEDVRSVCEAIRRFLEAR